MLVSVIVPVYNVEKYLPACLDSLLAQSLTDFELLLVDDGSRDASGAICDEYAVRDSRIRVFHIPNGGVSAARNLGLDHARGEFVVFVDADDRVMPDHLERFARSGIGEGGIAFCNLLEERPAGKHRAARERAYAMPDCRVPGGEAGMAVIARLLRAHCFGYTWNKMFCRATIEKHALRFDERIRYAEDEIFTARYCAHAREIVCDSRPTYRYRFVATSLLRGQVDPETLIRTRRYICDVYEAAGYGPEIRYLAARTYFSRLRRELRRAPKHSPLARKLAEEILDNWTRYRRDARLRFFREFYDFKAFLIGWACCTPGSPEWAARLIRGLHL